MNREKCLFTAVPYYSVFFMGYYDGACLESFQEIFRHPVLQIVSMISGIFLICFGIYFGLKGLQALF